MRMHYLDSLFLMPFHKVYLLFKLLSNFITIQFPIMEHPYLWAVNNLGGNKSFHCHSPFMNAHEL